MEEVDQGVKTLENNTDRQSLNPVPEIKKSQESSSFFTSKPGHSSRSSVTTKPEQSTNCHTRRTTFLSTKSYSRKDIARENSARKQKQGLLSSDLGTSFSQLEGSAKSGVPVEALSRPSSASSLYCSTRTSHANRKYGPGSSVSEGLDTGGQGTQYLLPETSGLPSFVHRANPELKRGRGRPRKEGFNPLIHKARSQELDQATSQRFIRRGLGRSPGRAASRGGRGGRRGRQAFSHVDHSVPTPSSRNWEPSDTLLTTAELADMSTAKPDISPLPGTASSSSGPPSDSAAGTGTQAAVSPVLGAQPFNPNIDLALGPESQSSGHLCALCNCGERSLLGQGETWKFEPTEGFDVFKLPEPKTLQEADEVDTTGKSKGPQPSTWRRSRGPLKTGRERNRSPRQSGEKDASSCHVSDELSQVGIPEDTDISQIFEPTGHVWVHHCCALWSEGVAISESNQLECVDKMVYGAMSQRCSHCRKFGATVVCSIPECGKRFHFPCASAGGCFQDMKTLSLLCPDHIDQAEAVAGTAACCIQCGIVGNVKEQLFCTSCGQHYHGNCLCPPVDMKPIVRAGWQCPNCKICQTCRTASDDSKMLVCDKCDKGYHTFCLRPVMTTIPKNGWKCKNCRVCTDCGSQTPGSGPSSRWHLNYSVCDSCYQQRNKGLCCPLCGKAYRHFHNKTMLPCMLCQKFVHIECDPSINPNRVEKELPQDYICTVCRETEHGTVMELDQQLPALPQTVSEESMESYLTDDLVSKDDPMLTEAALSGPSGASAGVAGGGLTGSSSQDSLFMGDDSSSSLDFETSERVGMISPGSRPDSFEFSKKSKQKSKHSSSERQQPQQQPQQLQQQPQQQGTQLQTLSEKRRGPKIKVKIGGQVVGITSIDSSSPTSHHSSSQPPLSASSPAYSVQSVDGPIEEKEKEKDKKDEDDDDDDDGDDHPSTLILAESLDMFIMDQDLCKACGSYGKDEESKMIVCTQCGQCYHPYCVSVTVTRVMLQKGWRCLDCTVCEGCGEPYDEARLLLCDDCDISYHTYCLDPPLETVPKGNWKCKWCVMCVNCGSTTPGYECQWMNNYTQCGPCHSKVYCPVCLDRYLLDQLIIQCQHCDRWLHCECDGLTCEDEAELAADYGYHCSFCRPKTGKYGPLPPPPPPPSPPKEERVPTPLPVLPYVAPIPEPPKHFFVDGVYLYQTGLNQIQRLQVANPKKYKQQIQRRTSQLDEPEDSSSMPGGVAADDQGVTEELGEDNVKKRKPRRVFGLGVGGFIVRQRSRQWLAKRQASYEEQEDPDKGESQAGDKSDKPKRRRKAKKSKLEVAFPFYMQEAFFGKCILDQTRETTKGLLATESDSEEEESSPIRMVPATDISNMKTVGSSSDMDASTTVPAPATGPLPRPHTSMSGSEQSEDIHSLDESELKDILHEFQENDDIFSIIHEELKDDGLSLDGMEAMASKDSGRSKSSELPDNLENMLSSDMDKDLDVDHMITEGLVHFDSKTVEDIFSGVLSGSQSNQAGDGGAPTGQYNISMATGMPGSSQGQPHPPSHPSMSSNQGPGMRGPMGSQPGHSGLPLMGMSFNPGYGPQMGQTFPQGMGQNLQASPGPPGSLPSWGMMDEDAADSNKRTILKWEQEEEMGDQATISCVLYVNMCHPDLKQKYPDWSERSKQIAKLWRKLTPDEKAPYLSKARKNRTSSRVQKAQKQVSQELQRRQEIQKQQDSEAMPPPPAPPPLPPGEMYHDGSSPGMVTHPTASPYPRHTWQEDGPPHKPASTPGTPEHAGSQNDQVFMQQGAGSLSSPDPYLFDPFSPTQPRPVVRPPHRLPGLQTFGASSPRDDDVLFSGPGMMHQNSVDVFGASATQDMYSVRRPQGPGPRMSLPGQVDATNPLAADPSKPRVSSDLYSFAPAAPQTPLSDDPFLPPGPPTPDPYHQGRRGDMFPGAPPQMRPPLSMGSGPGSPYPGSPVRMPDPSFRHPLSRSNSLPDPYSMQIGTPRPPVDPSMSRPLPDVGHETGPMYREGRVALSLPEEGGESPGNVHHQQLRVILGQQTKQRMAKKQEEAERMMQGPSTNWQGPSTPETLEGYQPRPPPFRGPTPQAFMRSPHPGLGSQGPRPPFYPGSPGMQRLPHSDPYTAQPQEGILPDQRSQFLQMMQERMSQPGSAVGTPGPIPTSTQQMPGTHSQFMSQVGELRQHPAQQQQPAGHSSAGEPRIGLTRQLSGHQQGEDDEIFTETEVAQASTSKVAASEDSSTVEPDTLLEGIGKTNKPSLSSEEDKNEDDDLLSADGTFDILKYADPDLDLDLDDKMFEHLEFMEDQGTGQAGDHKKSDEEKSEDSKDMVKDEKDTKDGACRSTDFQAQFLEFNQRQKSETVGEKEDNDKSIGDKDKVKPEVVQIAAMLQGTESMLQGAEAMQVRLTGCEPGTPDIKPSAVDLGLAAAGMARSTFNPNLTSPHMSPSQVPPQPGSSGLPSPKIMHSPRSGQPSPRTPGIQSPFNTLIGGRHSTSPHSQPMTPGGPQLSPFSTGNIQIPFSPPTSTGTQQYGQGPGSAPQSPYPSSSQPPFSSMSSPGPPHMMSPSYPTGGMGLRPVQTYNQMVGPRAALYGQAPHGIRPSDGQSVRFPRAVEAGMDGADGLGQCIPQAMTLPDNRPHPMYPQLQVRGIRGPPPSPVGHPSLQNQLTHPQNRHPFPGHPPRLSHLPQIRGVGPRQPGPPFPGASPSQAAQREQITLLDDLVEKEKEEQKRQAEQQAMIHRRDGSGASGDQGMPVMPPVTPTVPGTLPPHSVGSMPMRMEHPGMRLSCPPPDAGGSGWSPVPDPVVGGPSAGQFQPGFSPRMVHPGMPQRPQVPFVGPPEGHVPGPSGVPPQGQIMAMGPPTPVSPPTGDMGPDYERQAGMYEDWLGKQAMYLDSQVKMFEGQVNKLKRSKKTIQARQRLAKKNGQELNPTDTAELERISTEQSGLQKQLEAQRKLLRQHQHLMQDYKTKQQEQYGRMWTGNISEASIPGPNMPMPSHPRTPGGHNSVRLSPTARQEYDAYMQNRIRQANQMHQQQNRMRPPTTILGDNNPFSEAFQQREQIQRAAQTPGPPAASGAPPPPMLPPGAGPPPVRPPFGIGGPEQLPGLTCSAAPAGGATTGASTNSSSSSSPSICTSAGPPNIPGGPPNIPGGPQPIPAGQTMTPGPQGQAMTQGQPLTPQGQALTPGAQVQPMSAGKQGQMMAPMPPRGPMEGIGAVQFFRERNIPFEGGAGPRFPRPLGPGSFPAGSGPSPGQGPRLPPYPRSPGIYQQGVVSGPSMEQSRMPFQPGMTYQTGMPASGSQIMDVTPASQPVVKEKKKRKKKKKPDEMEGAHSQPLPPSLPTQTVLGQMNNQSSSSMTSSSSSGAPPKPAELPRPQSETERRILEILNNSQKELQNPSSPSSARGGKSPRSRSPARAQPIIASDLDKSQGAAATSSTASLGTASSLSGMNPQVGMSEGSNTNLSSCAFAGDRQGDGKHLQVGSYASVADPQVGVGSTPMAAPQQLMQQRMPVGPGLAVDPRLPGFTPQQHMHQLQTLAQMQQLAAMTEAPRHRMDTQLTAMTEAPRHRMDTQLMPLAGPRYPQMQQFPPGVGQGPHSFLGRTPHMRPGSSQFLMSSRMPLDPRIPGGGEAHVVPSHVALQQRLPTPAGPGPLHLRHSMQHASHHPPGSPLTQHPALLSHMTSESSVSFYQGAPQQSTVSTTTTISSTFSATIPTSSDSISSSPTESSPLQSISSSSSSSQLPPQQSLVPGTSIPHSSSSSSSSPHSPVVPETSSNIPADVSQSSGVHGPALSTSASITTATADKSAESSAPAMTDKEVKDENAEKVCDDGVHCGTNDEDFSFSHDRVGLEGSRDSASSTTVPEKVCQDGVHCGTDDEDDVKGSSSKKVCEDGIHCGTDDEDDVKGSSSKKVCEDGIHCGTDDEDDVKGSSSKKVCEDGIHCGTDDEDDVNQKKVTKKVCDDGIYCGTDNEDNVNQKKITKKVCEDGIHCGTDDEDDVKGSCSKKVCDDGIHCGTDDEDDVNQKKGPNSKKVCDDGIHCGTDDEDDVKTTNSKKVCDDGIHCGTDDEDDVKKPKKVCEDGIHCGTDDEDDLKGTNSKKVCEDRIHCGADDEDDINQKKVTKKVCDDGIHCGTDDEDDVNQKKVTKKVCDDGIHCGTDDEDDVNQKKVTKKVCDDGIHCGTDDEDDVNQKKVTKKVCDDGIHCGTDDEDDVKDKACKPQGSGPNGDVDSNNETVMQTSANVPQPQQTPSARSDVSATVDHLHSSPPSSSSVSSNAHVSETSINKIQTVEHEPHSSHSVTTAPSAAAPSSAAAATSCSSEDPEDTQHKLDSSSTTGLTEVIVTDPPQSSVGAVSAVTTSVGIPFVSIDSQISSQLAAVSRSLAMYKPRLGSDTSDNSADTVRPSDTLTAFSLAASSSSSAASSGGVSLSNTMEKETATPSKFESGKQTGLPKVAAEDSVRCEVHPPSPARFLDKPEPMEEVPSCESSEQQQTVDKPVVTTFPAVAAAHQTEDYIPSLNKDSASLDICKVSETFKPISRALAPLLSSSSSSSSSAYSSTTAQDSVPVTSPATAGQNVSTSSTPASELSVSSSSSMSTITAATTTTASQVQLPPVTTRSWAALSPQLPSVSSLTTGSDSHTATVASSSSRNGLSESRPVIPPLRIRMDGQSQPQVYESTGPTIREYHRSDFSSGYGRTKAEGDLKLVLRKSSDGTAELISGPSFREKAKRATVPADSDSQAPPLKPETEQKGNQSSSAGTVAPSVSPLQAAGATATTNTEQNTVLPQQTPSMKTLDSSQTPASQTTQPTSASSSSSCSSTSLVSTPLVSTPLISTPLASTPPLPPSPSPSAPSSSSAPMPAPTSSTPTTPVAERTEPFASRPGSGLFKNVTYTKSADTDVVKINVGCTKTSGEGTKKVIRSYTTDIHALERLQSTIDAVASGESTYEPDIDNDPPSRPESQDSLNAPTPTSVHEPPLPAICTMAASAAESTSFPGSTNYSSSGGQMGLGQSPQHLQQPTNQQMGRGTGQHRIQQAGQQPGPAYMVPQSQANFQQHQQFHPARMARPPLDLLAQVSHSALSSAGTAIPSSPHPTSQEQRLSYLPDRPPSVSTEHGPHHASQHQPFPGMLGPRQMASSPGMSPKSASGQSPQAYMSGGGGPSQQQFMPGVRFPTRMHHDMSAAPSYGMPAHPMSPTGASMQRQRPPHFGMGGDMVRMQRPPRGLAHPQHRPLPPEMMSPDHGMHQRMSHPFMSPSHAGIPDMSPAPHGMPHGMAPSHSVPQSPHGMPQPPHGIPQSPHGMPQSPHGIPQSPHGMPQTPHGMQRPPMMGPHHTMLQGGPPVSYPQTPMNGGGPLASLANFHPPGHVGVNTSIAGPHHQRPMFQQMMGGPQLRMMSTPGEGPHMAPHYRHMIMRSMTPGSQPPSQMSSPQMSPHMSPQMSPQMSPVIPTQPLRHLDNIPDDKSFLSSLPPSSSINLSSLSADAGIAMGGKPKAQRPYGPGLLSADPTGFLPMHQHHHMQAASDSSSVTSTPGLTSPMSDTPGGISSQVKLEPNEDSVSADGSMSRDDLDLDQKANHNELLKQLLGTGQSGRQLSTPDSEDSLPSLTPEQQRQLEMIDSMPLCKETEISTPEWESKTPEEKEKILEMRRQEYEQKRQEYEVSRKNKRKAIGGPGASLEKKKRKTKGTADLGIEITRKRSKKSKMKENQLKELEAQAETFLQQLHNMPPIPLQEPVIATSMSILPIKGAQSLTGVTALRGRFCSAYVDGIEDIYGSLLFPQPPPGLRPTVPSAEVLAQRQLASEAKLKMVQGMDPLLVLKNKEGGLVGSRVGLRTSPRLILPPQPRIEIKSEQMRDRKDERETPDTVVSSSSPEFGFNEQELEYPGLRPIDPALGNAVSPEESTSPVVPLIQPMPLKPAMSGLEQQLCDTGLKQEPGLSKQDSTDSSSSNIKQELGLMKQDSNDHEFGMVGQSGSMEQPGRDLTVNLPNLTSGLAQPFLDPALDQQVSVTLTLSTGAAQDIGAVISAIADLLKIAVPPTYEITRSPSPEMFRMSLTHKEEAVNIHTMMSTRPRFCQHCDVFVLCSGIAKYKREFPILLEQDPECGDDEMIFCSMNCSMQFSAALEAHQRQAQLRIKELDSSHLTPQTPPPGPTVKVETPTSLMGQTSSSATVASNVDVVIAAVAADMPLSPGEPDTPGDTSASPGTPVTTPTSPLPLVSTGGKAGKRNRRSSSQVSDSAYVKPLIKKWKGVRWRRGNQELLDNITKMPATPTYELDKLWKSLGIIHRPKPDIEDKRKCVFCQNVGDGDCDGPSRLLNMDVNKWVHLNCALWSYDVYETLNGALMNVELAFRRSLSSECAACRKMGATLACFKPRCVNAYHLPCAKLKGCMFYQDKTLLCPSHYPKVPQGTELISLMVLRRVYINRDEDRQVASMIHQEEGQCSLRIGSLILHSIGQLLPHQIMCGKFNTKNCIYPVGFRTSRFYWSYFSLYKRCRYICSIHDLEGEPEFRIQVLDSDHEEITFKDTTPAEAWMQILEHIEKMRREADLVKMFPTFMAAEELFGLTEPNVVKVLESLPGTDLLTNYHFRFGRSPLIEMPPAINPTGCARTEPKLRTHFRRPHTLQSTNSRSLPATVTGVTGDMNSPYLKQFVHSKSQQYRRLKTDWKSLVYLGRSRIQGLGLYAARDLEKHTMVIEYIGDLIRNEVANRREKEYESQNRGVYMFRIDNEVVIDATKAGGPARYINHSCNPNCVAEVVDIEKDSKIIIITNRKIVKGEELTYDYKFDFEDDQHKIPCMCGATNCRKWMN